jgi:hypothetical protein
MIRFFFLIDTSNKKNIIEINTNSPLFLMSPTMKVTVSIQKFFLLPYDAASLNCKKEFLSDCRRATENQFNCTTVQEILFSDFDFDDGNKCFEKTFFIHYPFCYKLKPPVGWYSMK